MADGTAEKEKSGGRDGASAGKGKPRRSCCVRFRDKMGHGGKRTGRNRRTRESGCYPSCSADDHGGLFPHFIRRVGFIQDKRFFSSAPKENLAAIPDRKERFPGAHVVGWAIEGIAVLLFISAVALGAWDGVRNGFGFFQFFARLLTMLYGMEVYDIFFFDWFLLCRSNFFPHFYPELKGVVGPHMFGYNKKAHIRHFALYLPLCAAAAWVCTIF